MVTIMFSLSIGRTPIVSYLVKSIMVTNLLIKLPVELPYSQAAANSRVIAAQLSLFIKNLKVRLKLIFI